MLELRDANLEQSNLETMVMPHANLSGARGTRIRTGDTMIFSLVPFSVIDRCKQRWTAARRYYEG